MTESVAASPATQGQLGRAMAVAMFLAFAFAYFFSALVRAITATLAPTLTQEFALSARELGLLAGGYFLGFAALQLPLGAWLDRHGPKRVILGFLAVAVVGCLAFAWAGGFTSLLMARVLCGVGVCACLMAPLTGFRRWLAPGAQLRANSWMLMTGSLGMVASTLPVEWLVPRYGWRALFVALAVLIVVSMLVIAWVVPRWQVGTSAPGAGQQPSTTYREVWSNAYFRRMTPIGFFNYGGMVAIQTLWAGPWMTQVAGYSRLEAAQGLFWINVSMLCTFWMWGVLNPALVRRGLTTDRLITWGLPLSFVVLASNIALGAGCGWPGWALFCVTSTFVSLAQPSVGMAFEQRQAGRALSAYNLVIFGGVFVVQWGIGLAVDGLRALGMDTPGAFQSAMAGYLALCIGAYLYFLFAPADNRPVAPVAP